MHHTCYVKKLKFKLFDVRSSNCLKCVILCVDCSYMRQSDLSRSREGLRVTFLRQHKRRSKSLTPASHVLFVIFERHQRIIFGHTSSSLRVSISIRQYHACCTIAVWIAQDVPCRIRLRAGFAMYQSIFPWVDTNTFARMNIAAASFWETMSPLQNSAPRNDSRWSSSGVLAPMLMRSPDRCRLQM